MVAKTLTPASRAEWLAARHKVITSTEIAALFGCNPYMTEFELYHHKRAGTPAEFEETERMKWGSRLESVIAQGVSEDLGLESRPMKDFMYDEELRIGASFDYFYSDHGILEIKNVDGLVYSNEWIDGEAPLHIELQVQTQLLVSERTHAIIAPLIGGNKVIPIERERDEAVMRAIKDKVKEFWERTSPPDPDFKKDAEFIISQYKHAEPNKVMLANPEIDALADMYSKYAAIEKKAEEKKKAVKAKILMAIGDCEKVKGNGYSISAGLIGPSSYVVNKEGYRNFKVNRSKKK